MSGANFQIDFIALGLDEKLEKIELEEIENEVDHIRDLLVFDDDTNETIGLVSGGYTHNIIGLILRGLAKKFGDNVAQAVVDGFELHDFGW